MILTEPNNNKLWAHSEKFPEATWEATWEDRQICNELSRKHSKALFEVFIEYEPQKSHWMWFHKQYSH